MVFIFAQQPISAETTTAPRLLPLPDRGKNAAGIANVNASSGFAAGVDFAD
jgi:hypothetical protein